MAPHPPGGSRVEGTALERSIAHEAASAITEAPHQVEHPTEEPPDFGSRGPGILELPDHGIHDDLRVALQGSEEEIPLAAERGIEAVAACTGAAHQSVQRRPRVSMAPKQLHGAVERLPRLEFLGPRHAPPGFKNAWSDISLRARRVRVKRVPWRRLPSYRSER